MDNKTEVLTTIPLDRYGELIATEQKFKMLKAAISLLPYSREREDIKYIFEIREENTDE